MPEHTRPCHTCSVLKPAEIAGRAALLLEGEVRSVDALFDLAAGWRVQAIMADEIGEPGRRGAAIAVGFYIRGQNLFKVWTRRSLAVHEIGHPRKRNDKPP